MFTGSIALQKSGYVLKSGNTAYKLYDQTQAKQFKGKTVNAAKMALKAAHCALGKVTPKGQTTGTVKTQSPGMGKVLPAGSSI